MLNKLNWTLLHRASKALLTKASIGLALVYVVFYLKKGGFSTAPLEITLAGSLLLLLTCGLIHASVPRLISRFEDEYKYEAYLHDLVRKKYLSLPHCLDPLSLLKSNEVEARDVSYRFDSNFGYTTKDLQAALGDTGIITYVARVTFLRANQSRPVIRTILAAGVVCGLFLMYWRPLGMIYFIYASNS